MYFRKYRDEKLRCDLWKFRVQIAGREYRDKGFATRAEAVAAVASLRTDALRHKYDFPVEGEAVLLRDLVAARVRDFDLTSKRGRRAKVVCELFRDHFPASQEVARLTAADVRSFKRMRVTLRRLRPNSINRELQTIAAMLNAAGNYFRELENWKHPRIEYEREERRERVITGDERDRLLAELRRPGRLPRERKASAYTRHAVADVVEVALALGMRMGEIRNLQRTWIDWRDELINLPAHATKTRRARTIPMSARVVEIIGRRVGHPPESRFVFTNSEGKKQIHEDVVRDVLRAASKRAGLDYGLKPAGGFTFHDTRHTAATRMLRRGHDLATVADVLGHSKETMTLSYAHSSLGSRRRAVGDSAEREGYEN